MIRISLQGRLGNQMFQYAAAHALARRHRTCVEIDTSHYCHGEKRHEFGLWRFAALGLEPISRSQAAYMRARTRVIGDGAKNATFRMEGLGYDQAVDALPDGTHLLGYFQSERYFHAAHDDIRRLFDLAAHLPQAGPAFLDELRAGAAVVAIHVRRGDYVDIPFYAVDLPTYHRAAMSRAAQRGPCTFLVFSDDIAWCRAQPMLAAPRVRFVEAARLGAVEAINEMALFAACDHHIIANSTFSWWAAWLGAGPDKTVIMPRQWLTHVDTDASGLAVPGWVQL